MTLLDTLKSLLGIDGGKSSDDRPTTSRGQSRSERAEPETTSEDAVKGTDEPAAAGGDATGSTESMVDEDDEVAAEPGEAAGPTSNDDFDFPAEESETAEADESDESAAAGGDAAGSTGSIVDKDDEVAAEPGEAAGPTDGDDVDPTSETTEIESDVDAEKVEESAAASGDASGSTGSVTEETNNSISATEPAEATGPTDGAVTESTEDHDVDVLKGIGPSYAEQLDAAGIETVADLAKADPADLAEETDIAASRVKRWTERAKSRRQ